jgi:hypothetical protein
MRQTIGSQQIVYRVQLCGGMNGLFGNTHDLINSRIASGLGISPPA